MYVDEEVEVVGRRGLTLLRVMAGSRSEVVLQSDQVEVVRTHWFERQILCPGWDCPACETYSSRVAVFFVALAVVGPRVQPVLVEVTASEWARCGLLSRMGVGVVEAGGRLEISRSAARRAARVTLTDVGGTVVPELRTRERLIDAISLLFNLPARAPAELASSWCDRVHSAVVEQASLAIRKSG